MSVSGRQGPALPRASPSSSRRGERPSACMSPPLSLSSPLIKKKAIQIPSFDQRGGLISERLHLGQKSTDRSFLPICSSKTSTWGKSCPRTQGEKASTLPRVKPRTCSSPTFCAKPSICIRSAPGPNSSPALSWPEPSDSRHIPAPQWTDLSPFLHQPQPQLRVSPTLTVPSPRLSPSPTSMCQADGQGGRQPSPVAKERRARSISISNTKVERKESFSKHKVLDEEALLDFTGRTPGESPHLADSDFQNQKDSGPQDSCSLPFRRKKENSSKDSLEPPAGTSHLSSIPKPKSNARQRQESVAGGATGTQTLFSSESKGIDVVHKRCEDSVSDGAATQGECSDCPPNRYGAQTPALASNNKSHKQMYSGRVAASPLTQQISFRAASPSSRLAVSPNIEMRRRRFDLSEDREGAATFLSGSGLRRHADENMARAVTGNSSPTLFGCAPSPPGRKHWSKDTQTPRSQAQGLDQKSSPSRLKTCLVVPQAQEAPRPHRSASPSGGPSPMSSSPLPKHTSDHEESHRTHKEAQRSDMRPADELAPPDHGHTLSKLLEQPSEKCAVSGPHSAARCPFIPAGGPGMGSKGVSDPAARAQLSVCHKPEEKEATATEQVDYPQANRAFIMEETEEPYYVTMYYPGSIYVDMSDVVPPEVRPKPAVPAKPPNVGAGSPSSPFPPQVPSIGGGVTVSAPPPSAIPVPIGSHGPTHVASHVASHGIGHGAGHGVGHGAGHGGSHAVPHSGGHGQTGSHTSGGGSTLLGYIGIDTIIEQMRKKTMKTGFDFNIMVVGNSGLGKSTLVNTLFKSQVSRKSAGWSRDDKIPKTVEIKSVSHVIEEGGVKMKLTVVDTPGFGDQINNDNCWEPISKYINEQYEKFLKEEVNITRKKRIPDYRVHCCLYFISPTGHSLRQLDMEFMKRLSHSVNIIPIIAKADTMTIEERQEFKQRVRKELEMSGIEFYPQKEFDDDMEDKSDNDKIREMMPFAVVGSDKEYQVNGKRVLGRKTAWGIVEVENPNHCEFAQLRDFLIRSHLQDLKEVTHNIHYETYRAKRLNENGGLHPITSNDTQESNL